MSKKKQEQIEQEPIEVQKETAEAPTEKSSSLEEKIQELDVQIAVNKETRLVELCGELSELCDEQATIARSNGHASVASDLEVLALCASKVKEKVGSRDYRSKH